MTKYTLMFTPMVLLQKRHNNNRLKEEENILKSVKTRSVRKQASA